MQIITNDNQLANVIPIPLYRQYSEYVWFDASMTKKEVDVKPKNRHDVLTQT
jgi:hypothetical protein